MINEFLLKAIKNKEKISVYFSSSENDKFCFGDVVFCNEDFLLLSSYTPYGDDDGFILKRSDEVIKIEADSKYNNKMEKLIKYKGTDHTPFEVKGDNIVEQILEYAKKSHRLLSILLYNSDVFLTAYMSSVTDTFCEAELINEYGEKDGRTVFVMDDIDEMRFCSEDETMLEVLNLIQAVEC